MEKVVDTEGKECRVFYIHHRKKDSNGVPKANGGITYAYTTVNDEAKVATIEEISYCAKARCSKKDGYSKKTGRTIATQRLQNAMDIEVERNDMNEKVFSEFVKLAPTESKRVWG